MLALVLVLMLASLVKTRLKLSSQLGAGHIVSS